MTTRLTFEGFRYQINADGSVFGQDGALRNERCAGAFNDPVVDDKVAAMIRAEAKRQRRNREARGRYSAMRSLGLVKTPYGWE